MSYTTSALIGRTLGKYEMISVVGGGGMGTVCRARQAGVQRDVAVKVLNFELSDTVQFVTRFRREAENLAALEHPHIIPVLDFGREGDYVFLVMALKTGGNLSQIIRGAETPLSDVQRYIEQIASALDYAHLRGIIHRDLKPANILLDEEGNTFLTDFGIARRLGETKLTAPGTVVGSPTYMAPEAWRGEDPSAETDVYSLGVIFFQLLTGKAPFEETKTARLMNMHLFDQPPLLRGLRPDLGEHFEAIMNIALSKDRTQRFHTAGEMAKAVRAAISSHKAPESEAVSAGSDKTMILQRTEPKPPADRDQRVQAALQPDVLRVPMPSKPEMPAAPRSAQRSQPTPLGAAEPESVSVPRDNTRLLVIGMGVIIVILLVAIIVLLLFR